MKALTYFAAALGIATFAAGCGVHQQEEPPLSGPSTFALSISVTPSPQTITQNGADASVVTAKVFFTDPTTNQTAPKANIPIRFDMAVGGQLQDFGTLSARNVVTDANGVARVTYTAPPMPAGGNTGICNGVPGQCVDIVATTTNSTPATSAGTVASASTTIALTPPGVILPPAFTPKAAFTFLPASVTVGQAVTFDASTSCATDASGNCSASGSITSYSWNFGDGSIGVGKTVTHTFNSGNTFVVTLTVTSDRGLSASTSQTVTIGFPTAPGADFVFSPAQPIAGQTVFFSADTSKAANGHNITQFSWTYGDGTTDSGISVSHAFAQPGTYNVVLSILDDTGQKATTTKGVTVSSANPTARLNVVKSGGTSIVADGSLSTAVLGATVTTYSFNFGDGSAPISGAAAVVPHTYGIAGTFTVTLVVTDNLGRTGSVSVSITVP